MDKNYKEGLEAAASAVVHVIVRSVMDLWSSKDSDMHGLHCPLVEKRTDSSQAKDCDVNQIMARYTRTGQLPDLVKRDPYYGDFSAMPEDLLAAYDVVHRAEVQFGALPADVRAECNNDPAVFLQKIHDPAWVLKHHLALPKEGLPGQPQGAPVPPAGQAGTGGTEPPAPAQPAVTSPPAAPPSMRRG